MARDSPGGSDLRLNIELTTNSTRAGRRDFFFARPSTKVVIAMMYCFSVIGLALLFFTSKLINRVSVFSSNVDPLGCTAIRPLARGDLVRREADCLLRQADGIFHRHVNPPDDEHQYRNAGQQIHPHVVARRDESNIGCIVVDGQLQSNGEAGDRSLGHCPVQHPYDADQESGERPPPYKEPPKCSRSTVLPLSRVTSQLKRAARRDRQSPIPGTEQRARALNSYSRMDMPVTRITCQHHHFKLVDSALLNED